MLNVLGLLVELEPVQAALLDRVLSGEKLARAPLLDAGALRRGSGGKMSAPSEPAPQSQLF